jgi:hypothetical protein
MTIRLHIERVVLEGVSSGHDTAAAFRGAFEREIARLVRGEEGTRSPFRQETRAQARATRRTEATTGRPARLAIEAAATVYSAVRGAR